HSAFQGWLKEVYGEEKAPERKKWASYDEFQTRLQRWSVADFDLSPLMDQWSFNDSIWCNLLGRLTAYANSIDPDTPCGIAGAQAPGPFGGYDYAKLMGKVQFIEAYDLGSSQSIIRSLNPGNALPVVTTHFHDFDPDDPLNVAGTIHQVWYYLAHGNAGIIGWVDQWFDADKKPLAWHAKVAPHYLEAGKKIGPLLRGAKWMHDGVAIYYSHASVQLGWILDAEAHGPTWRNRKGDHRLGASALVRRAWENMLRDEGLQYDFISYARVIREGIPSEYRVLILPATLCLSDSEAQRIQAFCEQGGVVIADYLPGLFDEHGRGRKQGGVLDGLFGVKHDPRLKAGDLFQERLWTEVDQEARYDEETFEAFFTRENTCIVHESGYHKAVRGMGVQFSNDFGKGRAVLLNLSPQRYNAYRDRGFPGMERRAPFMNPLRGSGLRPWVRIETSKDTIPDYEITYWKKNDRTLLFVCRNPNSLGMGVMSGIDESMECSRQEVTLVLAEPIKDVRNERTGERLAGGNRFTLTWRTNEAVVLSFRSHNSLPANTIINED
ncbi:MAG: beta-galactosidase trimerization domain-containing protein, partial [Planctomycetes bacterium]|nr:beta-galactosidase trimerization domain-containing protein [Planctomycetota bacterium]